MTDLHQVAPSSAPRDRQTVDLGSYRTELEHQRRFRLDQLTELAYEAPAASAGAQGEVRATLMRGARTALADIDAALFRLAIGRFGICQRCGRAITADRLEALPMASRCLRCQYLKDSEDPHVEPGRDEPQCTATTGPASASQCPDPVARDIVQVWGEDSFPASDPPANW
ncbi:TraR/DksA family transcriptional regulator [Kribbella steppae]|uniref:TraR/DksA family transcriptional regulator n=1 Tax=Kribbella steppae TaxID=2512223 RepID=A0A4R2H3C8_9ACTN|nr:TraR/DksA C4-type zinc finger protein [Kribbella steppae]TCO19643.1 TraR/DksA family transcriptional regulator [Kribbella steppae]